MKNNTINRINNNHNIVLEEINEVLTRRFGEEIWLKGMYNDEVIYIGSNSHRSIKIKIEIVE
jgi:hypothetical protein